MAACSEPFVTIPGGKLAGQLLDAPVEWSEVPDTIQMEMRPADPYSINIWSVGVGSDLYVATSADGTTWTGFLEADNSVRVRLQDVIYTLKASEVRDAEERGRVAHAYAEKYEVDPGDGWVIQGMIIRLDRP
ncbi:MAG: hypothetical protein OXE40_08030 [Gammaproteobacteria bacterium]|nr:hypothetical protein [Gammaproteobacteria bacterium]